MNINDCNKYYGENLEDEEKRKERNCKYDIEHQEELKERRRKYLADHPNHPKKVYDNEHREEMYKREKICSHNRRAYIKGNGGTMTAQDWNDILDQAGHKCLKCGNTENLSLDHIIPVTKGGRNDKNNTQVLCMPCNSSKGTRTIDYRPLVLFKQKELPI